MLAFPLTLSPRARALSALSALALLSGCAALPSSGPTAGEIRRGVKDQNELGFKIVDIDGPRVEKINAEAAAADVAQPTLSSRAQEGRTEVIGAHGDALGDRAAEEAVGGCRRKCPGWRVVRLTQKSNIHSYGSSGEVNGGRFGMVCMEKRPSYPQAGRASGRIVSGRR